MKKIASILLLGILLFNWFGYRFVVDYLENKANTQLEAQLDNQNYDESQLISIKVPTDHLAYCNYNTGFERVDGQVEIGGVQYKFVKRRLSNDSLELLCIPNPAAMRLQEARNDFFKSANDLQATASSKKQSSHPERSKNFSTTEFTMHESPHAIALCCISLRESFYYSSALSTIYLFTTGKPPETIA